MKALEPFPGLSATGRDCAVPDPLLREFAWSTPKAAKARECLSNLTRIEQRIICRLTLLFPGNAIGRCSKRNTRRGFQDNLTVPLPAYTPSPLFSMTLGKLADKVNHHYPAANVTVDEHYEKAFDLCRSIGAQILAEEVAEALKAENFGRGSPRPKSAFYVMAQRAIGAELGKKAPDSVVQAALAALERQLERSWPAAIDAAMVSASEGKPPFETAITASLYAGNVGAAVLAAELLMHASDGRIKELDFMTI
ncbi:MAG: hypothetical protein ACKVPX_15215 [Myxococcaceae bacterium]